MLEVLHETCGEGGGGKSLHLFRSSVIPGVLTHASGGSGRAEGRPSRQKEESWIAKCEFQALTWKPACMVGPVTTDRNHEETAQEPPKSAQTAPLLAWPRKAERARPKVRATETDIANATNGTNASNATNATAWSRPDRITLNLHPQVQVAQFFESKGIVFSLRGLRSRRNL